MTRAAARMAAFVTCIPAVTRIGGGTADVHAGVEMELIAEAVAGSARSIVRSTLTGDYYRVDPRLVVPTASLGDEAMTDLYLACSCL